MKLIEIFAEIDRLKEELDSLRPIDPEQEARIWQKFRLDWNFHSNHLEGNSLTFGETKSFLLHGITAAGKPLKDHLDIRGHNEALIELTEIIKHERPLTEVTIRELHKTILPEPYEVKAETADGLPTSKRIIPGQYKTSPNHVRTVTGETFYFSSPEETPAKMEELMSWFRVAKNDTSLHPLLLAAEYHYRFIRIHPFDDGNGRMARILMNLIFMMKGLPPVIIKTEKKEEYYRALQMADGGDINAFVEYIGKRLIASMELFVKGAKGENIEEDDDFFKEISLIKSQLIKEQGEIILKTTDSKKRCFELFFKPTVEGILKQTESVDDFFFSSIIYGSGPSENTPLNVLFNNFINSNYPNALIIYKKWQGLKHKNESTFTITILMFIEFEETYFGIRIHVSGKGFSVKEFYEKINYNSNNADEFINMAQTYAKDVMLKTLKTKIQR